MRPFLALLACALIAVGTAACSDDEGGSADGTDDATTTTEARPEGPAADLSEKLEGGDGIFLTSVLQDEHEGSGEGDPGYDLEEYKATGTATAYEAEGELSEDGRWTLKPTTEADYATRVAVRRPSDPAKFSGTVVVEWLNVSAGLDADPGYSNLREELVRKGHVWVGVSAQKIGVEGGEVAVPVAVSAAEELQGEGLKKIDPERYGDLSHPGDGYSYDIYTQIARALREGGEVLGGEVPEVVLAAGQSQAAFALVTYLNGFQPVTDAFDGFFVHSRGAPGLPVSTPGGSADIAGSIGNSPTIIRTDQDVPVMELQAESDVTSVLASVEARQDDSDTFRLWEVAGTAHADAHMVGPTVEKEIDCGVPINDGPMHVVAKAAFRSLLRWVREGEAPPKARRLEVTDGDSPAILRDADGIALGGVRTPPLDVPAEILSGQPGPSSEVICLLMGSTTPLPEPRLASLYDSRADYQEKYDGAIAEAVEAGFVLEDDREALEAYARPQLITE